MYQIVVFFLCRLKLFANFASGARRKTYYLTASIGRCPNKLHYGKTYIHRCIN